MTTEATMGGEFRAPRSPEFDTAMDLVEVHFGEALAARGRNADFDYIHDDITVFGDSVVRVASFTIAVSYWQAVRGTGDLLRLIVPVRGVRMEEDLVLQVDRSHDFFIVEQELAGERRGVVVTPDTYDAQFMTNPEPPILNFPDKLLMYNVIPHM